MQKVSILCVLFASEHGINTSKVSAREGVDESIPEKEQLHLSRVETIADVVSAVYLWESTERREIRTRDSQGHHMRVGVVTSQERWVLEENMLMSWDPVKGVGSVKTKMLLSIHEFLDFFYRAIWKCLLQTEHS